jgi:hypothetical protein
MFEGSFALLMVCMIEVAHTAFCAMRESCYRFTCSEKRITAADKIGPRRPNFLNTIIL